MIIKQFTSSFFFIIVLSCTTQDNSRTYQLAKTSNPPTINKNLIEEERSKKLICRVRPGVVDDLASDFRPTRAFNRLDFPTFDLPANAISSCSPTGICSRQVTP